jgi:hypothetical protein
LVAGCSGDSALDEPIGGAAASEELGSSGNAGRGNGSALNGGAGGGASMSGGTANGGVSGSSPGASGAASLSAEDDPETGIFLGVTEAHNAARRALGVDPELPALEWSEELAVYAQDWSDNLASRCGTIEHRMPNLYGENIAMRGSSRLIEPFSPEEAVAGWVAEDACWDFGTIQGSESCDAQCAADANSNGCGHYTQVVWRNTRRVGCGYSVCQNGFTYEVWVCNYDPPGNFIGQTPY